MALGSLGLSLILAAILLWVGRSGSTVPYIVEVDPKGGARAVGPAMETYRPSDAQIAFHLARFVDNVRSLSSDPVVVRQNWLKAYDFATDKAVVALDDSHVSFSWRDYAHGSTKKVMRLSAHEFLRRFLLHVLPDGFQRIRHYGFLANGHRRAKLAVIRSLLAVSAPPPSTATTVDDEPTARDPGEPRVPCPCCGGAMAFVEILPGPPRRRWPRLDTS